MQSGELSVAAREFTGNEIDALEERLAEFNADRTGQDDSRLLGFEATAEGRVVGAVAGWTWAGVGELRQLWVDQSFRQQGLGTRLLLNAIDEARSRGCIALYLATFSFQAPDFYARFGFERAAVISDMPPGHQNIIMRLCLTEEAPIAVRHTLRF